jgi:hypothetical protein
LATGVASIVSLEGRLMPLPFTAAVAAIVAALAVIWLATFAADRDKRGIRRRHRKRKS